MNIMYKVRIASNKDKHNGKKKGNDARCSMRGLLSLSKQLSWYCKHSGSGVRMTTTAGRRLARDGDFGENEEAI